MQALTEIWLQELGQAQESVLVQTLVQTRQPVVRQLELPGLHSGLLESARTCSPWPSHLQLAAQAEEPEQWMPLR